MNAKKICTTLVILAGSAFAAPAAAATQPLSALANPTLQELIDRGSSPVSVGTMLFSDFAMLNALPGTGVTAAQIQVQPFTNGGDGLQFVSSWFAANGSYVDEVISFNVQSVDPTRPIGRINLLSNGTAPVPTPGTFTTTTLVSQRPGGPTAAPVISTYNDGSTFPIDTTKPDINYAQAPLNPQIALHIIDTVFESSTAADSTSTGGVATESILQNAFVSVPEPRDGSWIFLPIAGLIGTFSRNRIRKAT